MWVHECCYALLFLYWCLFVFVIFILVVEGVNINDFGFNQMVIGAACYCLFFLFLNCVYKGIRLGSYVIMLKRISWYY